VARADGSYEVGGVLDAAWPAGMILVGAAAWQRPRRLDARSVADRGFLPVPLIAGLCATGLLRADHYQRLDRERGVGGRRLLLAVVVRLGGTFREYARMLRTSRHEAASDALTGLSNRRSLIAELERRLAADEPEPAVLALFDLDGFKAYNDASATRRRRCCSSASARAWRDRRREARVPDGRRRVLRPAAGRGSADLVGRAQRALRESGEGFTVGASAGASRCRRRRDARGAARSPTAACTRRSAAAARRQHARARRAAARVRERSPNLGAHARASPSWPSARAAHSGSTPSCADGRQRAELHDIGKVAIPTRSSQARPARRREWGFMRRHTLIGERSWPPRRRCATSPRSCARATSAGTARATPTARRRRDPARRARIVASATPATRWPPTARTARDAARGGAGELARCAGTSSTRTWSRRSVRCSRPRDGHLRALA
jgi:hypothetical protein